MGKSLGAHMARLFSSNRPSPTQFKLKSGFWCCSFAYKRIPGSISLIPPNIPKDSNHVHQGLKQLPVLKQTNQTSRAKPESWVLHYWLLRNGHWNMRCAEHLLSTLTLTISPEPWRTLVC